MKAEVKGVFSDSFNPVEYSPADRSNFFITLRLAIGGVGHNGADDFELNVCTPSWLMAAGGEQWGRFLLIVDCYDYQRIVDAINGYVNGCEGLTWSDVATKLSRMFQWEFEDYVD